MSEVILSASKIKTAQSCSWKYWTSYVLKLPQSSNDGASRGWICHLVCELLGLKKHKTHYNKIIKKGTIQASPAVAKLVHIHAKKLDVSDSENMELIDMMTTKALLFDFFGKERGSPTKSISEHEFNISVDENGKKYKIRGFIDKLFLYDRGKNALIRDFKTSKQIFKGKEISDNLQNLMYCLAVKRNFPKVSDVEVEFLFLKFDLSVDLLGKKGNGVLTMERITNEELQGFEYQLTSIQQYLEDFDEDCAKSDFAANRNYPSDGTFGGPLMCGKDGFKKSRGDFVYNSEGEKIKNFICEHRKPFDYYQHLDNQGNIIKCYKEKPDIKPSKGESIVKKSYGGCPHFYNSDSAFLV